MFCFQPDRCISFHNLRDEGGDCFVLLNSVMTVIQNVVKGTTDRDLLERHLNINYTTRSCSFFNTSIPGAWPPRDANMEPATEWHGINENHKVYYDAICIPKSVLMSTQSTKLDRVPAWETMLVDGRCYYDELINGTWKYYEEVEKIGLSARARGVRHSTEQDHDDHRHQRRRVVGSDEETEHDSDDENWGFGPEENWGNRTYEARAETQIMRSRAYTVWDNHDQRQVYAFDIHPKYGDPMRRALSCEAEMQFCPGRCGDVIPFHRQLCQIYRCPGPWYNADNTISNWEEWCDMYDSAHGTQHTFMVYPTYKALVQFALAQARRLHPYLPDTLWCNIKNLIFDHRLCMDYVDCDWELGFTPEQFPEEEDPHRYASTMPFMEWVEASS